MAYVYEDGSTGLDGRRGDVVRRTVWDCSRCVGCLQARSAGWALRCWHESQLYGADNAFLTLTISDDHLPPGGSLSVDAIQRFVKRLRKSVDALEPGRRIRFLEVGEYGSKSGRGHYHALIFNWRFPDRTYYSKSPSGEKLFDSAQLSKVWPFGQALLGDVNERSAAYCAGYCMSVLEQARIESRVPLIDPETGEIFHRIPQFSTRSSKPGIGAGWFERHWQDCFPHDYCVTADGKQVPVPDYYLKLLKRMNPAMWAEVKEKREREALLSMAEPDNSIRRLRDREQVALANLKRLADTRS